jgi:hypothetical protein
MNIECKIVPIPQRCSRKLEKQRGNLSKKTKLNFNLHVKMLLLWQCKMSWRNSWLSALQSKFSFQNSEQPSRGGIPEGNIFYIAFYARTIIHHSTDWWMTPQSVVGIIKEFRMLIVKVFEHILHRGQSLNKQNNIVN